MSRLAQLFVSMENEEEIIEIVEDGTIEDSMEYALLEVEEAAEEVEAAEEDVEELEEIEDGLGDVVEEMEESMERFGGLDQQAAAFAHIAVQAYAARLGLSSDSMLPSLESFGGDSGKQGATQISMEGIKDTIKKIWVAIKAAVQKAIKAVKDFFAKIFGGVDKVLLRAEALQKSVDGIKGAAKADATVSIPNPQLLKFGNKLSAATVIDGVEALGTEIKFVTSDVLPFVKAEMAGKLSALKELKATKTDEGLDKVMEDLTMVSSKIDSFKETRTAMSGDKVIKVVANGSAKEFSLVTAPASRNFTGETKIAPLTTTEMTKLLKETISILKIIKNQKDMVKGLTKSREDSVKAAEETTKVDGGDFGLWEKAKSKAILRSVQKDGSKVLNQISAHAFSVTRSGLVLVERSIKAYE